MKNIMNIKNIIDFYENDKFDDEKHIYLDYDEIYVNISDNEIDINISDDEEIENI